MLMSRYAAVYNVVFPFPVIVTTFLVTIFHICMELILISLTTSLDCVKLSCSDFLVSDGKKLTFL